MDTNIITSIRDELKDKFLPVAKPAFKIIEKGAELATLKLPKYAAPLKAVRGACGLVNGLSFFVNIALIPKDLVDAIDSAKAKDFEGALLSTISIAADAFSALDSALSFAGALEKLNITPALPNAVSQIALPLGISLLGYSILKTSYTAGRRFQVMSDLNEINVKNQKKPLSARDIKVITRFGDKRIAQIFQQNRLLTAGEIGDCKTLIQRKIVWDGITICSNTAIIAALITIAATGSLNPAILPSILIATSSIQLVRVMYDSYFLYEGLDHLNGALKTPPPPKPSLKPAGISIKIEEDKAKEEEKERRERASSAPPTVAMAAAATTS
jgi:hypothetical protein